MSMVIQWTWEERFNVMKSFTLIAMSVMCYLASGVGYYAWGGDLDSALENISISSEAQSTTPKKNETKNIPCTNKASDTTCQDTTHDSINTKTYEATTLQQSILSGTTQNVTINGVQVGQTPQTTFTTSGF